MHGVQFFTHLSASMCNPLLESVNHLVASDELVADQLQQVIEFVVICAHVCLYFGQEVVVCERGCVMY